MTYSTPWLDLSRALDGASPGWFPVWSCSKPKQRFAGDLEANAFTRFLFYVLSSPTLQLLPFSATLKSITSQYPEIYTQWLNLTLAVPFLPSLARAMMPRVLTPLSMA